jgi:quercetin dioxygenase-like cupin family protein
MNKHKPVPKHLKPGEGEILTLLGEPRAIKVLPSENVGAYLQFETSHAPGMAIPLHAHREEDEAFYVLAGEFEFIVGAEKMIATTGAFLFAPRGALHRFTVLGRYPGRLLITVSPGTQHERFFRDVVEIERTRRIPPERPELLSLAQKRGWVFPSSIDEETNA